MKLKHIWVLAGTIFTISAGSTYAQSLFSSGDLNSILKTIIPIEMKTKEINREITVGQTDEIKISDIFTQKDGLIYTLKNPDDNFKIEHKEGDVINILKENSEGTYNIEMKICTQNAAIPGTHEKMIFRDDSKEVLIEDEE